MVNIQITMAQFRIIRLNWHQSMVFQFLPLRNGEMPQMGAKVSPIGYMKRTSQFLLFVISRYFLKYINYYNFGLIRMRLCLRISEGNQSYCFRSEYCYTNNSFYSNHSPTSILTTWSSYGNFAHDNKKFSHWTR